MLWSHKNRAFRWVIGVVLTSAVVGWLRAAGAQPTIPPGQTQPAPAANAKPGLLAPALLTYAYGATLDGPPDPNVWDLASQPDVALSYSGGVMQIRRGAQVDPDWSSEVIVQAKPRLNFTGQAGTSVEWRFTLNAGQQEVLVKPLLIDPDAQRYFELDCNMVAGAPTTWECDFHLRDTVTQQFLWRWANDFIRQTPMTGDFFDAGEFHTFRLVYNGGQALALYVDDQLAIATDFAATPPAGYMPPDVPAGTNFWQGMDWLTVGYQVNAWPGRTNVLDSALDIMRFSAANDVDLPLLTASGAPSNSWTHASAISYSGSDGGAGLQCVRAAWDAWPVDINGCYTPGGSTTIPSSGTHTLYLRSWDWAGNQQTASYPYLLLDTPTLHPLPATTDGPSQTLTWSDASGGMVTYELQQATDAAFTNPVLSGWVSGTSYTFSNLANCQRSFYRVRSRDSQGLLSPWSAVVSATSDFARPSGTLTINRGAAYTNQAQVTLTLSTSDDCAGTLQLRLRNGADPWGAWLPFASTVTWNLSNGDGVKTVEADLADSVGGLVTALAASITLDTMAPVVSNLAAIPQQLSPNGDGRQETTAITALVSDASPNTWQVAVVDAGGAVLRSQSASSNAINWNWDGRDSSGNPVADGQYEARVTAQDAATNTTLTANSTLVVVDTQAPQGLGLYHPQRGDTWAVGESYYTNRNRLDLRGYTGISSDRVAVNGATVPVGGVTNDFATTLTLIPGAQTMTVVAEDLAGNQTVQTRTVVYDDRGPTLSAFAPTGTIADRQPVVSGAFAPRGGSPIDVSQVKFWRSGVDVTASVIITPAGFRYLPDPALSEGEHEFNVTLVNLAGNVSEFGWSVTVDRHTELQLLIPPDGAVLNIITQTVSGQSEPHAGVSLARNGLVVGQTTADGAGDFTFPDQIFPTDGLVTLMAMATDALGNQATTTATVTMALDKPGAGVRVAPNPFATSTVFGLQASGLPNDPLASWRLWVSGQPITSGVSLPPAQWRWDGSGLTDGSYPVRLAVTTTQGITQIVAGPMLVRDRQPPAAPVITNPIDGHVRALPQVPVSGKAEPGSAVTLRNGGLFTITTLADAGGAWRVTMLLEGGWNSLQATATDKAGQISAASNVVRVQVPVEPPLIDVGASTGFVGLGTILDLWADARGVNHPDGPTTVWVRSNLPAGGEVNLSQIAATQGQPVGRWTFNWTVAANTTHGPHTLLFTAEDQIGLRGQGRSALFVDAVLPSAPLLLQPVGEIYLAQPQVEVVGHAEALGTVMLYVNDLLVQSVQADAQGHWRTALAISEGLNRLYAKVSDASGNLSLPSLTSHVLHDHTPPQITGWVTPNPVRSGVDLTYRVIVTDASPLARAQVQLNSGALLALYPGNGGWIRLYPNALPQGVYPLTFHASDIVGNVGVTTSTLTVDNTPPTFSAVTMSAGAPYAYLPQPVQPVLTGNKPTAYYGVGSGLITVTTALIDGLAGVRNVTFPVAAGGGGVYSQTGASSATVQHVYAFGPATTFSGTVVIQAADQAGNIVMSNIQLLHDTIAPTLSLNAFSQGLTLSIAWSADDSEAGIKVCTLELIQDSKATLLSTACSGNLAYPGIQDVNYGVRLAAWDNVTNQALQEQSVTVNSVTKYYYHGANRIVLRKGGQLYYLHNDHLGSISLTTDSAGNMIHEARYLPYGQVR